MTLRLRLKERLCYIPRTGSFVSLIRFRCTTFPTLALTFVFLAVQCKRKMANGKKKASKPSSTSDQQSDGDGLLSPIPTAVNDSSGFPSPPHPPSTPQTNPPGPTTTTTTTTPGVPATWSKANLIILIILDEFGSYWYGYLQGKGGPFTTRLALVGSCLSI